MYPKLQAMAAGKGYTLPIFQKQTAKVCQT